MSGHVLCIDITKESIAIGRDAIGAPPALLDSQAGVPQQGGCSELSALRKTKPA
jgi:hypothetical protein